MTTRRLLIGLRQPGVLAALGAALLFGAGTPFAKQLLGAVNPWMLAALLYLGAGIGLSLYRLLTKAPRVTLARAEHPWFAGAIVAGGIVGPVLLMHGLMRMPASGASLLLNAEGVFTAVLAWVAFKENVDRRIALGMLAIVLGAAVLSWEGEVRFGSMWAVLALLGACLAWGLDNNLTRKVSLTDATWIAAVKGLVAGAVNLVLALTLSEDAGALPALYPALGAMLIGLLAYGVSLALYVVGLRHLGTARTGAYFSLAPFLGAALALAMGEPLTWPLVIAATLMGGGLWLHLTEQHSHLHTHTPLTHDHEHTHDAHHLHAHDDELTPGTRHRHTHAHAALSHSHAHFPDAHHQHVH